MENPRFVRMTTEPEQQAVGRPVLDDEKFPFTRAGALEETSSPALYYGAPCTIVRVVTSLVTAGSSGTIINVLVGGEVVYTETLSAADLYEDSGVVSLPVLDQQPIIVEIDTAGGGAEDLTCTLFVRRVNETGVT